ncbi:DUF4350 domain-containing protein [Kiritimatiellota bacterium B12222]|nr:DUF4350 domain-containing protein [Kiritimatiellota bacterium B12222]
MTSTSKAVAFIFFILLLMGLGLSYVFRLEYAGGSQYGNGSSLRADVNGSMILYESLEELDDIEVARIARPLEKVLPELEPDNTLLVILNTPRYLINRDPALSEFLEQGGRLLVSPAIGFDDLIEPIMVELDENDSSAEDEEPPPDLGVQQLNILTQSEPALTLFPSAVAMDAPREITWELTRSFEEHEDWETLYAYQDMPVIIRREIGDGEIIMLADDQLLNNRAMYKLRQPEAIHWLLNDRKLILFEEAHLGLAQPKGLAALMWEYHLQSIFLALILPFLLYIWKVSVPLLPSLPPAEENQRGPQGRLSGFRDLLARHISSKEILALCLKEWKASDSLRKSHQKTQAAALQQAQTFVDTPQRQSDASLRKRYQDLHQLLTQKRTKL